MGNISRQWVKNVRHSVKQNQNNKNVDSENFKIHTTGQTADFSFEIGKRRNGSV